MSATPTQHIGALYRRAMFALRSTRGRNVLTYLMCLCVAFGFWVLMSLDREVQRDFDVPLQLDGCPDSVTMLGTLPSAVSVTVQAKNSQLLRFSFTGTTPMKVRFSDYVAGPDLFAMPRIKLDSRLREYFGDGAQILNIRPDSILATFTTSPGIKLPLHIVTDITTDLQYTLSGPVTANVDSVTLYSNGELPRDLSQIETLPVVKSGLHDTTRVETELQHLVGVRIIPDRVTVTIPVEPLIRRTRTIRVYSRNVPEGYRMITFPTEVQVSYLVPISLYNEDFTFVARADYNDISASDIKIPLKLVAAPGSYQSPRLETDSVEYVLERIR